MQIQEKDIKEKIGRWGNKAAANWFFHKIGLFEKPFIVCSPDDSIELIEKKITNSAINKNKMVVRFSHDNEINLPRGFFSDKNNAVKFIKENIKKNDFSAIIIHELIKPIYSYEIYWKDETLFIQMLPGIWEVDNGQIPDIIIHREPTGTMLYKYNYDRVCKYLNKDFRFRYESKTPMPITFFKNKFQFINKIKDEIGILKTVFNPMFFRAIEDNNGKLYFLNVRETEIMDFSETSDLNFNKSTSSFHVVRKLSDVNLWNREKNIIFDMTCSREDDTELVITVKRLAERKVPEVFINYGMLSHPAIVLREYGIKTKQLYSVYDKIALS